MYLDTRVHFTRVRLSDAEFYGYYPTLIYHHVWRMLSGQNDSDVPTPGQTQKPDIIHWKRLSWI